MSALQFLSKSDNSLLQLENEPNKSKIKDWY